MRNLVDTPKLQTEDDQFPGDGELSTSHLDSGLLAAGSNLAYSKELSPQEPERPNTDWLRVLASQPEYTETFDDALPEPPPQPSGMALHTAPPRIRMTIGSRLALLLRRGTLLIILAALAVGLLAAGVYGLPSTTWFSPGLGPTPATPAPANPPGGSAAPQQPPAPAQPPASLGDSSTTSGAQGDATTLVEQGVAAYKAGNYERAIGFMESAVDINGSDAVTYYQLGLAYLAATGRAHALED